MVCKEPQTGFHFCKKGLSGPFPSCCSFHPLKSHTQTKVLGAKLAEATSMEWEKATVVACPSHCLPLDLHCCHLGPKQAVKVLKLALKPA